MSPVDIPTVEAIVADNRIDEHEQQVAIEALKVLAGENAEVRAENKTLRHEMDALRAKLENSHDAQMHERDVEAVKIVISTILGLAITMLGIYLGLGMEIVEIGINMLPIGGSALMALAITYLRKYLPQLFKKDEPEAIPSGTP